VILNPAPAQPLSTELLDLVDTLTPNELEAGLLAGVQYTSNGDFLSSLPSRIRVPQIVVTLGSKGAAILTGGSITGIPAYPIRPVDTTASGDAFNGALAVALARGEGLEQAVLFANAAGALAATRPGAQPSLPSSQELKSFIQSMEEVKSKAA
jgi:ribokinase